MLKKQTPLSDNKSKSSCESLLAFAGASGWRASSEHRRGTGGAEFLISLLSLSHRDPYDGRPSFKGQKHSKTDHANIHSLKAVPPDAPFVDSVPAQPAPAQPVPAQPVPAESLSVVEARRFDANRCKLQRVVAAEWPSLGNIWQWYPLINLRCSKFASYNSWEMLKFCSGRKLQNCIFLRKAPEVIAAREAAEKAWLIHTRATGN